MAPQNAADATQTSRDGAVFLQRFDEVIAAGWVESALPPEDGAEKYLVKTNQPDQQIGGHLQNSAENSHRVSSVKSRLASF